MTEGRNLWNRLGARPSMTTDLAERPVTPALVAGQSGRNPPSFAAGATGVTVVKGYAHEESKELITTNG